MAKSIRLNISERNLVNEFLKSTEEAKLPSAYSYLFAAALAMIGLLLFVSTTVITLDRLDSLVTYSLRDIEFWAFMSGLLGGATIIAVGLIYLMYAQKVDNKRRLGTVLRKLLNGSTAHSDMTPLGT